MQHVHGGVTDLVLQEDSCGPHRVDGIAKYLSEKNVTRMKCLAQSTDLNPIENVWGYLKQNLRKRAKRPTTYDQLFSILQTEWDARPDDYLTILVISMPTRVHAVKRVHGGSSKYLMQARYIVYVDGLLYKHNGHITFLFLAAQGSKFLSEHCTCISFKSE